MPAFARCAAIRAPIVPAPRTATFLMDLLGVLAFVMVLESVANEELGGATCAIVVNEDLRQYRRAAQSGQRSPPPDHDNRIPLNEGSFSLTRRPIFPALRHTLSVPLCVRLRKKYRNQKTHCGSQTKMLATSDRDYGVGVAIARDAACSACERMPVF